MVHEHAELRRAPLDLGEVLEGASAPGGAVARGGVQEHDLAEPPIQDCRGDAGSPPVPRLEYRSHEAANTGPCLVVVVVMWWVLLFILSADIV